MANFKPAYKAVIKAEGGYQAYPQDRGNYDSHGNLIGTKYGISAPLLETYLGRRIYVSDMKNLELSTVEKIYKKLFWDKIHGDSIKSQRVAHFLFDWAVNSGPGRAARKVQQILRDNFKKRLSVDGAIGPITVGIINSVSSDSLMTYLIKSREAFFRAIVANNPSQKIFLQGWLNRLSEFEKKPSA